MDALMAALVVAALAMIGERPAWLAARLADRGRAPGLAIASALVALLLVCGIAAALGATLAPRLTPEAKLLMLALALLLLGGGVFGRVRPPAESDRASGFAGATVLLFTAILFGGLPFVVLTLAARTPLPWLAAAGGTIGAGATLAVAAVLGEAGWLALPLRAARIAASVGFLLAGAVLALEALGLA